jgi:phenylpropionate dioxygenase-like ring-hydroxylating dioxygenase large terminal subunit
MLQLDKIVDQKSGLISNEVFSDELYQLELERVFGRCWLLLGHDSMLPGKNDYFTHYMGEDSVIVTRDSNDKIRAFLNKCPHRGNTVCLYDRGNAASFTCAYHGWTFTDGELTGVPHARSSYREDFDMTKWGLKEVPRVENYGGLIFGCWDSEMMPLEEFLNDGKWYLDNFLLQEDMGGLEVLPGPQRYVMPTNWKLLAENFAGDDYHFISTHASVGQALSATQDQRIAVSPGSIKEKTHDFSVVTGYRSGVPHGFLEVKSGDGPYNQDLRAVEMMDAESMEWLMERQRRLQERMKKFQAMPQSFHAGNIFPNFALIGVGTALYGKGLIMHHPRGPHKTEVWMWCAVEKSAPEAVKKRQNFVLMQRQAAAGMVAPDDHEIFERISETLHAPEGRKLPFHYAMAMGHDDDDPRPEEWAEFEKWPGHVIPQYSEITQREFYRYWCELMNGNQ